VPAGRIFRKAIYHGLRKMICCRLDTGTSRLAHFAAIMEIISYFDPRRAFPQKTVSEPAISTP